MIYIWSWRRKNVVLTLVLLRQLHWSWQSERFGFRCHQRSWSLHSSLACTATHKHTFTFQSSTPKIQTKKLQEIINFRLWPNLLTEWFISRAIFPFSVASMTTSSLILKSCNNLISVKLRWLKYLHNQIPAFHRENILGTENLLDLSKGKETGKATPLTFQDTECFWDDVYKVIFGE